MRRTGMATGPRDRLKRQKERVKELAKDGTITNDCRDRLLEYAEALDPQKARYTYYDDEGNSKTFAPRSIEGYLRCPRICAEEGFRLLDGTASEFNDLMGRMCDDGGKEKTTLVTYQNAATAFYRYHDDLGINPDDIEKYSERSDPKYDETDMFTEDEVDALREACGATKMPVRNRALLELLIFTGQRLSALLTLRIKDVELNGERGYIYLNDEYADEHSGLKHALQRGRKRPIFGARKYLRDWIDYHPNGSNPDAWLFVGDPSHWKTDPDDHWSRPSARQRLQQIKKEAEVEKPVEAHNFRHYCATVLYRDYDLDRDTIRMLLGHAEGSTALEETYSHLFDDDYIRKAEETLGYREEENRSPLTPETCPTCGELLKDHWRQCPNCQERFGPEDEEEGPKPVRLPEEMVPIEEFHDYAGEIMSHMIHGFADEAGIEFETPPKEMAERLADEAAEAVDARRQVDETGDG